MVSKNNRRGTRGYVDDCIRGLRRNIFGEKFTGTCSGAKRPAPRIDCHQRLGIETLWWPTMKATPKILIAFALAVLILPRSSVSPAPIPEPEPSLIQPAPIKSEEPAITPYPALKSNPEQEKKYKAELRAIATAKGLPEAKIRQIEGVIGGDGINKICPNGESGWHPDAIGDNGTSFGLVQIHLLAHPNITREQALNPTFALNFIVDEFLKGNEWKWTCYKAIYG